MFQATHPYIDHPVAHDKRNKVSQTNELNNKKRKKNATMMHRKFYTQFYGIQDQKANNLLEVESHSRIAQNSIQCQNRWCISK